MIGAALNVFLNAVFIPRFGFIAAAYTTLICYLVFMVLHYVFSRKVLKEQQIQDPVYDNKTVFLLSGVITAVGLGCMATFPYTALRVALIAVLLAVGLFKRETIKQLIASIR